MVRDRPRRGGVRAVTDPDVISAALRRPEVFAKLSAASKAKWQRREFRDKLTAFRRANPPAPAIWMRALAKAQTPEAHAKSQEGCWKTWAASRAHQECMVAEMASRSEVGPEMRDVALMQTWLACGLRLGTLARWLGVNRHSVREWVRYGVKPKVKKP